MSLSEKTARLIAQQKLNGTGLTLRSGPGIFDGQGWHFPVRGENEADEPYDGHSMTVMVLVVPGDHLM